MKKSLIIKIATTTVLLSSLSFGLSKTDKAMLKFEKNRIVKNKDVTLKKLELSNTIKIDDVNGWNAYLFNIKVDIGKDKIIETTDMLLSNGTVIAKELYNIKTKRAITEDIHPKVKESYYNQEHLILGNHKAKYKLLLFSDPHCPFCKDFIPEIIEFAKKRKNIALYYYHFPLPFHPMAETIVKASIVAKHKGIKNVILKTYKAKLTHKKISIQKALNEFNKALHTNISIKDIERKYVLKELEQDEAVRKEMLIQGTPTLFINGKKDITRSEYLNLK